MDRDFCEKIEHICDKCSECKNWNDFYRCCEGCDERKAMDLWEICDKNEILMMDSDEYYDFIIRDNTRYYLEDMDE